MSSIIFKVIAGFFFYGASLLAFVSEPQTGVTGVKLTILIGFSIPAVVALCVGLALTRFRNWKRDTGIVLLSASGTTASVVLTFVCMLMTEEFRAMMKPDTLTLFSDYLTGGGAIVGFAGLGWILLRANGERAEPHWAEYF